MSHEDHFRFHAVLSDGEWVDDGVISVTDGIITRIAKFDPEAASKYESVNGVALPGVPNVHSHAFQRGIAGSTEYRTSSHDSFWTWRNRMYEFVNQLDAESLYPIAHQLYQEMLQAGYTWVGEFHYVHNDLSGRQYENPAAMAEAVIEAALDAGIGICLIPTLYQRGGFDREIESNQRRFWLQDETFFEIIERCQAKYGDRPNFEIGMALHSLRAVESGAGQAVVAKFRNLYPERPIHIHVAEQLLEQEECLQATGQTPIDYLYSQFDVDANWCLIHATHASPQELSQIAESGAVVGLCPTTEANLGDGIFPTEEFLELGGRFSIGSDSQVAINPASELRLMEYGQRLVKHRRAVLGSPTESTGRRLFRGATSGGAAALGINAGSLSVGRRADLIVLDPNHPVIDNAVGDRLLDRFVFCEYGNPIIRTMVGGKWVAPNPGR